MDDCNNLIKELEEGTANFYWEFTKDTQIPEGFFKWFIKKAKCLGYIMDSPNDILVTQTTEGQCFHNSQLVAKENKEIKYYEGLIYGPKFKNCLHHGFNLSEKGVIDVTYLKNKKSFEKEYRDEYYIYFGVHIPTSFIEKYKYKLNNIPNQHNPILLDFYSYPEIAI